MGIQLLRAPQEASSKSSRDQVVFSTPYTNVRMGEHASQTPALATELANSPQCCGRHKKGPARGPGRFSLPLQTHAHPHTPTAQASLTLTKANPPLFASRVVGWVMRAWATPAAAFPVGTARSLGRPRRIALRPRIWTSATTDPRPSALGIPTYSEHNIFEFQRIFLAQKTT